MSISMLNIVALGEVLWDIFPDGARFGGAPANFACHVAQLLASPRSHLSMPVRVNMLSGIGGDPLGESAIESLDQKGVSTEYMQWNDKPTGKVTVLIDPAGNATYQFLEDTAWDNLAWTPEWNSCANHADIVCYGTLGQRSDLSKSTIRQFLSSLPPSALRIFDVNLRSPYWDAQCILDSLKFANIVKLNDEELPVLTEILGLNGSENEQLEQIMNQYCLSMIALTKGAAGSVLLGRQELGTSQRTALFCNYQPAVEIEVVDTVGAGDAFTAAMVTGILFTSGENQPESGFLGNFPVSFSEENLSRIHRWSSQVAGFVASSAGATPALPKSLAFPQ